MDSVGNLVTFLSRNADPLGFDRAPRRHADQPSACLRRDPIESGVKIRILRALTIMTRVIWVSIGSRQNA